MKRLIITFVLIGLIILGLPATELSDKQRADIEYLFEEEKLARDIYLELADIWNLRIFENIAGAEDQHMDSVSMLASDFDLDLVEMARGDFFDPEIQKLYIDLLDQGSSSPLEALEVGRMIEIADIADIESMLDTGLPDQVSRVLSNLLRGSQNHLSAFNRQIAK